MDILAARASAREYFVHLEKSDSKIVFLKDTGITFAVGASEHAQYQLLEAFIDVCISEFFDTYGAICCDLIEGMPNLFNGFQHKMDEICNITEKEKVKWIKTPCKHCGRNIDVCVKKSLIENAPFFPTSLVHLHEGHGLLIHIDRDFNVRGAEIVDING